MASNLRRRIHELLRGTRSKDPASRLLNEGIVALILLNVVALVLETVAAVQARYGDLLHGFELVSVAVFTVEWGARVWTAPEEEAFRHPLWGRLRFVVTPLALVDLVAILPFYLPLVLALDLRVLRVLRLFRIARILKLARYSKALQSIARVFERKKHEIVITLAAVGLLLVLSASLMYYAEHEVQPEAFASIPQALWWAVVTLTTVGYGDVVPITPAGRVLGAIIAILGVGMIALPAGILGSGFVEELQRERGEVQPAVCPHCGGEL